MSARIKRQVGPPKTRDRKVKRKCLELPTTAPSIPSKIDRKKNKTTETQNGFGCSTERFSYHGELTNEHYIHPGPGSYENNGNNYLNQSKKVSMRGYTAMISLDPRFTDLPQLNAQVMPGPGTYTPSLSATKPVIREVNFGKYKNSRRRENEKIEACQINTPGPGYYCVENSSRLQSFKCNLGASSFNFKGRKEKDFLLQSPEHVAVGVYNVGKSLDFIENFGNLHLKGSFLSTTNRGQGSFSDLAVKTPGPGQYEEREPVYTCAMYCPSACFDTSLDRFGMSNNTILEKEETPGPGSYYPSPSNRKTVNGN